MYAVPTQSIHYDVAYSAFNNVQNQHDISTLREASDAEYDRRVHDKMTKFEQEFGNVQHDAKLCDDEEESLDLGVSKASMIQKRYAYRDWRYEQQSHDAENEEKFGIRAVEDSLLSPSNIRKDIIKEKSIKVRAAKLNCSLMLICNRIGGILEGRPVPGFLI